MLPTMLASLKRAAVTSGKVAGASRRVPLLGSPNTSNRVQIANRTKSSPAAVSASAAFCHREPRRTERPLASPGTALEDDSVQFIIRWLPLVCAIAGILYCAAADCRQVRCPAEPLHVPQLTWTDPWVPRCPKPPYRTGAGRVHRRQTEGRALHAWQGGAARTSGERQPWE